MLFSPKTCCKQHKSRFLGEGSGSSGLVSISSTLRVASLFEEVYFACAQAAMWPVKRHERYPNCGLKQIAIRSTLHRRPVEPQGEEEKRRNADQNGIKTGSGTDKAVCLELASLHAISTTDSHGFDA
jgi:hypothetical protein